MLQAYLKQHKSIWLYFAIAILLVWLIEASGQRGAQGPEIRRGGGSGASGTNISRVAAGTNVIIATNLVDGAPVFTINFTGGGGSADLTGVAFLAKTNSFTEPQRLVVGEDRAGLLIEQTWSASALSTGLYVNIVDVGSGHANSKILQAGNNFYVNRDGNVDVIGNIDLHGQLFSSGTVWSSNAFYGFVFWDPFNNGIYANVLGIATKSSGKIGWSDDNLANTPMATWFTNSAMGTVKVHSNLVIEGYIQIPTGAGAGKVLTSDGTGIGSWTTPSGGSGTLYVLTNAVPAGTSSNVNFIASGGVTLLVTNINGTNSIGISTVVPGNEQVMYAVNGVVEGNSAFLWDYDDARLQIPSIRITDGAGSGKVLTSGASGVATWETPNANSSGVKTNAWNSTVVCSFITNSFQQIAVTNQFTLSATSFAPGLSIAVNLVPANNATNYTITLDSAFKVFGSNLLTTSFVLGSNKWAMVSLTSMGAASTDVIAALKSEN